MKLNSMNRDMMSKYRVKTPQTWCRSIAGEMIRALTTPLIPGFTVDCDLARDQLQGRSPTTAGHVQGCRQLQCCASGRWTQGKGAS